MNPVLIIGAGGQDGRLLSESLAQQNKSFLPWGRSDFDPADAAGICARIGQIQPSEIYYLAAHHQAAEDPAATNHAAHFQASLDVHVTGVVNVLESIRTSSPQTRLFYAASSHIFGQPEESPQNETTPPRPRCVYGITKTTGLQCCRYYRNTHGVMASAGILYNHESVYRSPKFVSQKIVRAAAAISRGEQDRLELGSLSARVDWGYAPDYVDAMQRILALPEAGDFVIATGENHSVQEFVEIAFSTLGLNWHQHVSEKSGLVAKPQSHSLIGDTRKLRELTGWKPSLSFIEMVETLVRSHLHER
jgi:GDPmannose 4,6-dehydratase